MLTWLVGRYKLIWLDKRKCEGQLKFVLWELSFESHLTLGSFIGSYTLRPIIDSHQSKIIYRDSSFKNHQLRVPNWGSLINWYLSRITNPGLSINYWESSYSDPNWHCQIENHYKSYPTLGSSIVSYQFRIIVENHLLKIIYQESL